MEYEQSNQQKLSQCSYHPNGVNTELITEKNMKYFNDTMVDGRFQNSTFMLDETSVKSFMDNERNRIIDAVIPNTPFNDRMQIIPNDRKIPNFLQYHMEEAIGISRLDARSSFHSKGVQTRISGVRTISNLLSTHDFGHPATIMNPTARSKDPSSCISYASELNLTRSQLYNVHCNYQKLKLRFHKLHEDYYKLIRVAGELTNALENSARGNPVDLPNTLKSCIDVYPDLFNQNVRDDNTEIHSIKSEIELQHHDLTENKQPILGVVPISSKLFDFKKIKLHLINGNVKTKLLLLQALRWKITLSQPAERDEAIHEYTSSDLLGLHGQIASDSGKSVLPYLLIPLDVVLPHPLQQSAARLLNTLASLRCGRDYLSVGPTVLNVVIQCLDTAKAETVDAFTCDMILATLQKLSLRRQQRLYMIGMGLVEWLIYHLRAESNKIGTYRLEYTTALLWNLSLHREAQVRAATMTTMVLSTLTELLSSSHLPALPYVNGTLNNFLANRTINEEAKKIGLDAVLEYHRKRNSGEIRRHLDYILNRHRRNSSETVEQNTIMVDDDNEELDVLENELDELDPVKVHAGELFGEALLATCYSISPKNINRTSTHDDNGDVSSSRSSKLELPESGDDRTNEIAGDAYDSSSHERLISPSTSAPRFTPTNHKLTNKNTTLLKLVEETKQIGSRVEDHSRMMIDKSVEIVDNSENTSDSESDAATEYSQISQGTAPSTVYLNAKDSFKTSNVTVVNSATTLISTYESPADADGRMSSIASLPADNGTNVETVMYGTTEKNQQSDEDAFLSKPRIMRTPPRSAAMRFFTPRDDDKVVEDIVEQQ